MVLEVVAIACGLAAHIATEGGKLFSFCQKVPIFKLTHYVCHEHTNSEGGVELQER
jgi:hypothetical protein